MKDGVDLHIHTTASDGQWKPEEVVRHAKNLGLSAIAICDHDTTAGVEEAVKEGEAQGVEVVPAVEINTDLGEKELHILGYMVDIHSPYLQETLQKQREARLKRLKQMVRNLQGAGFKISFDEVISIAKGEAIGRPHIAQALVLKGYAQTWEEAFSKFLIRGAVGYVPRSSMSWDSAIRLINLVGGIAVLAHPGKSQLDFLIPSMIKEGLQGIEVWHPAHSPQDVEHYLRLAQRFSLLPTGGSDAHGPDPQGNIPIGKPYVPYECLANLKAKVSHSSPSLHRR